MKVNHFTGYFDPNFSETSNLLCISRELVKLKNEVYVYTTRSKTRINSQKKEIINGIIVNYFPMLIRYRYFHFSPALLKALNKIDGDIIHAHGYRGFAMTVAIPILKKSKHIPVVLSPYGSIPYEYSYSVIHKFMKILQDKATFKMPLRLTDIVLAESEYEKKRLIEFGVPSEKIRIVYVKVDTNLFRKKRNDFFGKNEQVVLYVGRVNKLKGLEFLIRVFRLVHKKSTFNVKLIVVGPIEDQLYFSQLMRLVKDLNLEKHIIFYGLVSHEELPNVYSSAKVLVLAAEYQNISGVLLEAQACECPVIATNVGGLRETVIHGKTGFLVKLWNAEELADKILLLLRDDEKREAFGRNARRFVSQRFSAALYTERVLRAYNEIL